MSIITMSSRAICSLLLLVSLVSGEAVASDKPTVPETDVKEASVGLPSVNVKKRCKRPFGPPGLGGQLPPGQLGQQQGLQGFSGFGPQPEQFNGFGYQQP